VNDLELKEENQKVKLSDLKAGTLFKFNNTIALKSEYRTNFAVECYIVGSGEYFWGGTKTARELNELLVTPLKIS
jgi:hypothetical protein